MEFVVLVNEGDEQIGTMEKLEAHRKGLLHRAFSVFLFNDNGEMLLQQRAATKYHSPLLWTNACCSHPRENETVLNAAKRRLMEEMNISTPLSQIDSFIYKAELDNNLTEHELDYIIIGQYNNLVTPNADEVQDYCYLSFDAIESAIELHPNKFTVWFKIALPIVKEAFLRNKHLAA